MKGACLHAGGAPAEAAAEQQHRRACRGAPVAGAPAGSRLQGPGGGRHLQVPLPTLRSTTKEMASDTRPCPARLALHCRGFAVYWRRLLPVISLNALSFDCWVACRRQFVGELLMSIHGSALADGDLVDAIEDVMCRVCVHAPTYAVDLVQHAGVNLIY